MNFCASPKAVLAVALTLLMAGVVSTAGAQSAVEQAPPPARVLPPWPQVQTSDGPAAAEEPAVAASEVVAPAAFGDGVITWTEDAESGLTNVVDGTVLANPSYPLIVPGIGFDGSAGFHLCHPNPTTFYFELDVDIDVQPSTQLFFMSKLQWATTDEYAVVRVSTDGGSTWPDAVYTQAGTTSAGEGTFNQRSVDLGAAYAGQQVRLRFGFEFTSGSYYPGVDNYLGWLVDNIQITGEAPPLIEYSIGNPTPTEVLYLEVINRARADAVAEATRLANSTDPDVTNAYAAFNVTPSDIIDQFVWYVDQANGCMVQNAQPLAFQGQLMEVAQKHTQDMFNNQFQGHTSMSPPLPLQPGDSLGDRLGRVGYSGGAGENVYSYSQSVEHGHAGFDVDWGNTENKQGNCYRRQFGGQGMQNPAGHRKNIHNGSFNEVGLGVINGTNGSVGPQLVTQNFGSSGATYITGVIYEDDDGNGMYSALSDSNHEGRGGIRIDVAGSAYYTVSTASGAYAIPVSGDGTYDVTISGDGIETFNTQVVVSGGRNVKLDHTPVNLLVQSRYYTWAAGHGLVGGPNDDDDKNGVSNLIESLVFGMVPTAQDADLLPKFVKQPGGDWTLTLNKQVEADDVSVTVMLSTDLINWLPAGTMVNTTVATNTAGELTITASGSHKTMYARYDVVLVE